MTVIEKTRSHEVDVNREETVEEAAALAPGILLRGAEVGMAVLIGLLVCPPLAILAVVVAVPLLAVAIVLGLLAAILAMPYLLVRHVREHHRSVGRKAIELHDVRSREEVVNVVSTYANGLGCH